MHCWPPFAVELQNLWLFQDFKAKHLNFQKQRTKLDNRYICFVVLATYVLLKILIIVYILAHYSSQYTVETLLEAAASIYFRDSLVRLVFECGYY